MDPLGVLSQGRMLGAKFGEPGIPHALVVVGAKLDGFAKLIADLDDALIPSVEIEGERLQPDRVEAFLDHLERGLLLGDEEDGATGGEVASDQVGDGLRFSGTRRALEDECASLRR